MTEEGTFGTLTTCLSAGCFELVEKGRCRECAAAARKAKVSPRQGIYGAKWAKRRRLAILKNPWCSRCGPPFGAQEWDHIVPAGWGGGDEDSNLWFLCKNCHLRKTRLEIGKAVEARGLFPDLEQGRVGAGFLVWWIRVLGEADFLVKDEG